MARSDIPSLVGLDLNASRVRAVAGNSELPPQPLLLEGASEELPLALSMENRQIDVGSAGLRLCRRLPHLACVDFLAHLGTDHRWSAGRHRLNAVQALGQVFDHMRPVFANHQSLALAFPAYLGPSQTNLIETWAARSKFRLIGLVATPLAAALMAHAVQPWTGAALIADADEHALTWSVVQMEDSQARLIASEAWPLLGLRLWRERLLDVLSDRCVRQSRRDPRDCADAEQSLYEQIDPILEICRHGQMAEAAVQTTQWYQNLIVQPGELCAACASLARQGVDAMSALQTAALRHGGTGAVLLTDAVARLPGLAAAVETIVNPSPAEEIDPGDDFGAGLLDAMHAERASLYLLAADAPARAAHALAVRWARRELPPGRIDAAPLLPPPPPDAGPPRLHFRGQEFVLRATIFRLGRHPDSDLVFDSELFPTVSAQHCEIIRDRLGYLLRDRSRHGTLLNDVPVNGQAALHSGDRIRLGPNGPVLRFLGGSAEQRPLMTTA